MPMENPTLPNPSRSVKNLYTAFVRERRFTRGVSNKTTSWYEQSWKAFEEVLARQTPATISRETFSEPIQRMLERRVSPISVNTYTRAINAFLRWLHDEQHTGTLVVIPRLKEPKGVITTFHAEEIQRLFAYRPKSPTERRVHTLALLVADTGLRLNEALSLRRAEVDFENLLLTVREAKGGKQRVIPFSTTMRKLLYKYVESNGRSEGLIFSTRDGLPILQNNIRRDFAGLCKRLKIGENVKGGFHVLRHGFATEYLRRGGDVLRLGRVLGHSSLEITRKYVHLQTSDLQAVHDRLSVLGKGVA